MQLGIDFLLPDPEKGGDPSIDWIDLHEQLLPEWFLDSATGPLPSGEAWEDLGPPRIWSHDWSWGEFEHIQPAELEELG
jgi:hypothetical protein